MDLLHQAGWCFAATAGAANIMYWLQWRHYLPGGKYDA